MSERFHAHSAHSHLLGRTAAARPVDGFAGRIAVMTAVLSTAGAIFSYEGGASQNEALLLKGEAAIHRTEAANLWVHYQAKGQKQAIAELTVQLPGVDQKSAKSDAQRYALDKESLRRKAEAQEQAAKRADEASETAVRRHHRWAQAVAAVQVAVAMAAISLLSRRRWLKAVSYGVGALGGGLAMLALRQM
ncbi:DUF4337 family protein [Cupriavidus necator]|uniref:DUF4337 family protein n=1 Tax=Cupriavidus necator TaxID=106590 RepID=A0A367PI55_CUPNE|nr:DUF4337 family protein [Cupriavidus necator]QQX86588.1 DUF4337 family protein [Cupriavidus necator]RCJ06785.1 DUF4337 family protein [Cupriavidus necator]